MLVEYAGFPARTLTGADIQVLPRILNGCILVFVFSVGISDLYILSRTLYALARDGKSPAFLAKTDRRVIPVPALAVSAALSLLAFMNVSNDSKTIFTDFINCITIFGLILWVYILASHVNFIRACRV